MSNSADNPIIVLFEDRPKQRMVYQLNLSIYLDARVKSAVDGNDLHKAATDPEGVQMIIIRANYKGTSVMVGQIIEYAKKAKLNVPIICFGDEPEKPGVIVVADDTQMKPLLQTCAKLLGVTAQKMVSKERSEKYEILPDFLNMLFTLPCDVYESGPAMRKIFSEGESVSRKAVEKLIKKKHPLLIDSLKRLRLVNAVTEQSLKASAELENSAAPEEKKMSLLAASVDMVASQFQNSGMDEETVKLANSSIQAIEKIANSSPKIANLVKQLMDSAGGFRYAHSQLITFLGFHVIKMMGWWGEEQRNIFSQAAFYHDISLASDDESRVHNTKELAEYKGKNAESEARINTHAQLAARELQSSPDISPEVVRLVLQHHGSPQGKGFVTQIGKLDNLAKTFILAEEWAHYLIELSETDAEPKNEAKIQELKTIYKDDICTQIIETFRYLDAAEFNDDFLSTKEVELALEREKEEEAAQENAQENDQEADTAPAKKGARASEAGTTVKNVTHKVVVDKTETEFKADKEEEKSTTVKGVTHKVEQDKTEKAFKNDKEEEKSTTVKGVTHKVEQDKTEKAFKSDKEEEKSATVKSVTHKVEQDKTEKAFKGDPKEKDSSTTVKNVTHKVVQDKTETAFKADEPEAEDSSTFKSVTHKVELDKTETNFGVDEKDNSGLAKQKFEGVTSVRKDEEITVKADPSQSLVDKSIKKFKADAPEKEKEMKIKALSGATDLMKAAVSGAADKVKELLKDINVVELRKTDAEGRNAVHYAAMGGNVEILKALKEKGLPLHGIDSKRRSSIFLASLHKHNDAFDYLLAEGGKVNQQAMGGMTVAMVAAFNGNMHILKIAMEKGVRLDTTDHNGKTAMEFAKQAKQAECLAYLQDLSNKKAAAAAAPAPKKAAAAKIGA